MNLKITGFILSLIIITPLIYSTELNKIARQKLATLNFTKEQLDNIEILLSSVTVHDLPQTPIINFINETVAKKGSYEKMLPAMKSIIESLILAKEYIAQIKKSDPTGKFSPYDTNYCTSLLSTLILSGLTKEEFIKFMTLFMAQKVRFDDAIIMLNYYIVLKRYLPEKQPGITNPAEIIFLKYSTRSVKEMSRLIQAVTKFYHVTRDKQQIYEILDKFSSLSTSKLVQKIDNIIKQKIKTELKQEVDIQQQYDQRQRF